MLNFVLPTKEEFKAINPVIPKISKFGFKGFSFKPTNDENQVLKEEKLFGWDNVVLNNKINHFNRAFLYSLLIFERKLPKELIYIDDNYRNFIFYLEFAYISLSSIVDVLLQIINIYFNIDVPIKKVTFNYNSTKLNMFTQNLKDKHYDLFNLLVEFHRKNDTVKDIRNSSIHRYPDIFINMLPEEIKENDKKSVTLSSFTEDLPDCKELLDKLKYGVNLVEELFEELKTKFIFPDQT